MRSFLTGLLLVLLLAGCELYGKIGGDDTNIAGALPVHLQGEWVFPAPGLPPAERYIITETTIQYIAYQESGVTSYRGTIVFISNWSSTAGVIIIRYIEGYYPTFPEFNGNSYFAIFYRILGTNSVQLANATILPDSPTSPDTATQEEAIARFTRGRSGNYVGWGHVQAQWRVR